MNFFEIENSWVDTGYIIGFTIIMGVWYHWTHFLTMIFVLIITYLMKRKDDAVYTEGVKDE